MAKQMLIDAAHPEETRVAVLYLKATIPARAKRS
jgi:Ribonuclease G/E